MLVASFWLASGIRFAVALMQSLLSAEVWNDLVNKVYDNLMRQKYDFFIQLLYGTQEIAKKYGAVCTPDFFGYDKDLGLQYRGRFKELKDLKSLNNDESDLKIAMKKIALTQKGPNKQIPSMGCNIKWFN